MSSVVGVYAESKNIINKKSNIVNVKQDNNKIYKTPHSANPGPYAILISVMKCEFVKGKIYNTNNSF